MFNINPLIGAGYTIISKIVLSEELPLTIDQISKIQSKSEEAREYFDMINLDKPASFVEPLEVYLERQKEKKISKKVETNVNPNSILTEYIEKNISPQINTLPNPGTDFALELLNELNVERINDKYLGFSRLSDYNFIKAYREDANFVLYYITERCEDEGQGLDKNVDFQKIPDAGDIIFKIPNKECPDGKKPSEIFWESELAQRQSTIIALSLVTVMGERSTQYLAPKIIGSEDYQKNTKYVGPLEDEVDYINKMKGQGYYPNIILYGKPGTGKTTFCKNISQDIETKTLKLGPPYSQEIFVELRSFIHFSDPDLVILEDFDSFFEKDSTEKGPLSLLESINKMNLVLICTVNSIDKIPDAIKRPGRIDRIISADGGNQKERYRTQDFLADKVGIDIPESKRDKVDEFHKKHSSAHLEFLFKEIKSLGWDNERAFEFPFQTYES